MNSSIKIKGIIIFALLGSSFEMLIWDIDLAGAKSEACDIFF